MKVLLVTIAVFALIFGVPILWSFLAKDEDEDNA